MSRLTPIFFFICWGSALGQTSVFKSIVRDMNVVHDTSYSIEKVTPTSNYFDFTERSDSDLEALFLSKMADESKGKKLERNENLTQLAVASTKAWYGSQYSEKDRWKRLEKYFNRANHQIVSNFNLIEAVSFRIPLMEKPKEGFYYDRQGPEGSLNLFVGDRPMTKEEKEEEHIPVSFLKEEQIVNSLVKNMNRYRKMRMIQKGTIDYIGVSITVDQKSLFKNKIPTARVVVFLGARRLLRIKT